MFTSRNASDRYKARISDKSVASLTKPQNKWLRRTKRVGSILHKAFAGFLAAIMIMLAMLMGAAPASAVEMPNPIASIGDAMADVIQQKFCSRPYTPEEISGTGWLPSSRTGLDPAKEKLTFTEKYGSTGGLVYTNWEGPRTQKEMDGEGTYAGKVLVKYAGGPKSLESWGDKNNANDNEATAQKGFFDTSGECMDVGANFNSGLATIMLQSAGVVVYTANEIYAVSMNSHAYINSTLGGTVTAITMLLKQAIFLEFLTPILMISALWMAWVGLVKKKSIVAAQGVAWMIGSSVAAVFLMTQPLWLPNAMDTLTSAGGNAVMTATSSVATEVGGTKSNYCQTSEVPAKSAQNVIRENSCTMALSFTYVPWVQGQFGQSPNVEDTAKVGTGSYEGGNNGIGADIVTPPRVTFGNVAAEPQTWALHNFDSRVDYEGAREDVQNRVFITVAANQLYKDNYNKDWRGEKSLDRVADAALGLVASLAYLFLMIVLAVPIIVLNFAILLLVLVSPLFFLFGVHPGYGRRVALGWLETILGVGVKILALKVYLAIVSLLLAIVVTSASDSAGSMHSVIFIIALAWASYSYKGQILKLLPKPNLGSGGMSLHGQNEDGKLGGALNGGGKAAVDTMANKGWNALKNSRNDKKEAARRVDSHSPSAQPPRPKEDAKDSGPATSDTPDRASEKGSAAGSEEPRRSRKSGPFNPEETEPSENQKTDGAGGRPAAEDDAPAEPRKPEEPAKETPDSDGAGTRPKDDYNPENSSYDDSPATRKDRKEQIKFETQRIREDRLRNGSSGPSIIAATAKGTVNGYRSGSAAGGLAAGTAAAQSETQRIAEENEAIRRAERAQYEADQKKALRSAPRSGSLPPLTPTPKKAPPADAPKRPSSSKPEGPKTDSTPKGPGAGGRPV